MYSILFKSCAYLYFGLVVTEDTYFIIEIEWNPKMHMIHVNVLSPFAVHLVLYLNVHIVYTLCHG